MERIKESNGTQQSKRIKEFLQGMKIEKKKKKKTRAPSCSGFSIWQPIHVPHRCV